MHERLSKSLLGFGVLALLLEIIEAWTISHPTRRRAPTWVTECIGIVGAVFITGVMYVLVPLLLFRYYA